MGERHRETSPLHFVSALAALVLLESALLLSASVASADPLSALTDPVGEATAPVVETVETVVPPVSAPAPSAPAPAPEVRPSPAPHPPSAAGVTETTSQIAKAATESVTTTAGTVTSAAEDVIQEAEKGAGEAAAAGQRTVGQETTAVSEVLGTPASVGGQGRSGGASASAASRSAQDDSDFTRPQAVDTGPADGADPTGLPARLWHPLIHVWPAVALVAERALGDFVGRWSRSVLADFEAAGLGSPRGESGRALTDSAPASHASDQPPFAWLSPPSLSPYDWIGGEAALPAFVFFLILAAGSLAILLAMRRELGAPLLPRRITRRGR